MLLERKARRLSIQEGRLPGGGDASEVHPKEQPQDEQSRTFCKKGVNPERRGGFRGSLRAVHVVYRKGLWGHEDKGAGGRGRFKVGTVFSFDLGS